MTYLNESGAHDNVHALIFTGYLRFQWFTNHFFIIGHDYLFLAKHNSYCSLKLNLFLNYTNSLFIDMFYVSKLHSLFTSDTDQIKELQHISI